MSSTKRESGHAVLESVCGVCGVRGYCPAAFSKSHQHGVGLDVGFSSMLCSYCMRLTVHLPDDLARLLKQTAENEGKSMSALTAEALALYLRERRRRALGLKVLERAGKAPVDPKALEALEEGRRELDRP